MQKPKAKVKLKAKKKEATPQVITMDTPGLKVQPAGITNGDVLLPILSHGIPVKSGSPLAPNPTANFNVNTKDGITATPNNDGTAIRLNLKQAPAKPATKAQVESESEGEAFDGLW